MLKVKSSDKVGREQIYNVYLSEEDYKNKIDDFKTKGQEIKMVSLGAYRPWKLDMWEDLEAIVKPFDKWIIARKTPVGHVYKKNKLKYCIYGSLAELEQQRCNVDFYPFMFQIVRYWDNIVKDDGLINI